MRVSSSPGTPPFIVRLRLRIGHRPFLQRAPPGRPLGAWSSRCSRLDHSGPAWHLPRDWIAEVTALPQLEPPGTFVPVDASLRFSGNRWDPGPKRLPFPLDSSVVLAPPSKSSKRITPHTNSPPSYQIA